MKKRNYAACAIDINHAIKEFEKYLNQFDREQERIKLKIVHTYGVMDSVRKIASLMNLDEENTKLAELIALLHDIGRFEQARLYNDFDPRLMDHAQFGVWLLFQPYQPSYEEIEKSEESEASEESKELEKSERKNLAGERTISDCDSHTEECCKNQRENPIFLRRFLQDETWDDIIYEAIDRHSRYAPGTVEDQQMMFHIQMIRDADKLDNCRVKLEESVEVLLNMSAEEAGKQDITELVWESCEKRESVHSLDRKTMMDRWVSYLAYFYDINFKETYKSIQKEGYVDRLIDRIEYTNAETKEKMESLRKAIKKYIEMLVNGEGKE